MNFEILRRNKIFNVKIGSTMRLIFKYSIFSSIVLLGLSQIACADIRVPASLAAEKARRKPPANVSNYVLQSNSNGITLTWTNPTDSDFSKVLILKNTSPIVDSPTTGKNYAGVTLIGGSQMMYNAVRSSFTDTEITEGVAYFYKIFSYDTLLNYASGVELAADRIPPANVTNHVLQSNSNGITLTWTNPTDADFSKVLILRHTNPIVDSPTTGRDYASGASIGSSTVVYNGDLETFQITGNEANILHYYKIFAYDVSFNYASGVELSAGGADTDHDGLIEIKNATMLNNMRYDLAGTSYKTSVSDAGNTDGCPAVVNGSGGCNGYELSTDINLLSLLDTNGNGMIDTTMEGIDKNADGDTTDAGEQITVIDTTADTSWVPVGDNSTGDDTTRFTGIFEGNNHTIANLWVNITPSSGNAYAGLFGVTGGTVVIRNVGIVSGAIYSFSMGSNFNPVSGGLVGKSAAPLTIINSTFSGSGGVFSSAAANSTNTLSRSGGMVGQADNTLTIIKCTFSASGGVSSSSTNSSSRSDSGGLVSAVTGISTIIKCSFSGLGGISSSSTATITLRDSLSGGLIGFSAASSILTITNSFFSGSGGVSSSSSNTSSTNSGSLSGGLIGYSDAPLTIMNSYFSGSGEVSSSRVSSSTGSCISGGLVGAAGFPMGAGSVPFTIMNSYFSGGRISSSFSGFSYSGGLVGRSITTLTISNSYFSGSGEVSSSGESGGLVGDSTASLTITNSYWNTNAPQSVSGSPQNPKRAQGNAAMNPSGTTALTLVQLQAITGTHPSGLPHSATDNTQAWDLGTDMQLPAVKLCIPTITNGVTNWAMCASYGALLAGQR